MAMVSSHWVAGERTPCNLHAVAVENRNGWTGKKDSGVLWGFGGSSCSGAASSSASAVAFGGGRVEGCGRAWSLRREQRRRVHGGGIEFLGRVRVGARATAALDGKDLCVDERGGEEGLFDKFLEHAVRAVGQRDDISPLPCQDEFRNMVAADGQAVIKNVAFESEKLRLFRCASINGGENMQVLNVAICSRPEYDLPIFCADFFSTPRMNIVVLDLNPLYDTEQRPDYKDKYFSPLLPLGNKYAEVKAWQKCDLNSWAYTMRRRACTCNIKTLFSEHKKKRRVVIDDVKALISSYYKSFATFQSSATITRIGFMVLVLGLQLLPWGDKLTSESIQFFSPIVLWTRPGSREEFQETVFSAFKDYLAAWLDMAEKAKPSEDADEVAENRESHHRYLMWRATKDPGRYILMRLYGEELCERYISEFLFNGVNTLGEKEFLDYFPEYRGAHGSIIKQRSVAGKAYEVRPWNKDGIFAPSLI